MLSEVYEVASLSQVWGSGVHVWSVGMSEQYVRAFESECLALAVAAF